MAWSQGCAMDLDLICELMFLPQTVFSISMSFKPHRNKHTKENFQIQNFTGLKAWVVFRHCVLSGCYLMHVFKSTKWNIEIKPKEPHGDCDAKCSTNTFGVVRLQCTAFKRWRHGRSRLSSCPLTHNMDLLPAKLIDLAFIGIYRYLSRSIWHQVHIICKANGITGLFLS